MVYKLVFKKRMLAVVLNPLVLINWFVAVFSDLLILEMHTGQALPAYNCYKNHEDAYVYSLL